MEVTDGPIWSVLNRWLTADCQFVILFLIKYFIFETYIYSNIFVYSNNIKSKVELSINFSLALTSYCIVIAGKQFNN